MWIIKKLPKILINQIAAWEVVERPVSIVKELVENSIDALSTQIKIEIKNWWIDEIIITDNWIWIVKDDLEILTEKHTTSKIKDLKDLHNIMTFWFRWEALASISSVSKFKIISKQKGDLWWYSMEVLDWEKQELKKESLSSWTKIIVKDLFYNTPARLNYLKKWKTEYGHIYDFINNIALAYPKIAFEFISEWKTIFKYKENDSLKTRIYNIYWEEFYENLLNLDFSITWLQISGYISNPKVNFSNKNRQLILVNKRIISSPLIFKAIKEAYNRFIPHNNFPAYMLNLQINPEEIDVNVHPRKLEIRFARKQEIYKAFYNSVLNKLENSSLISKKWDFEDEKWEINNYNFWKNENLNSNLVKDLKNNYYSWSWTKFKSYSPYKNTSQNPNQTSVKDAIAFSEAIIWNNTNLEVSNDLHYTKQGKIIWQVFNSYIIVEKDNKIIILDQHALAERIIYEKLLKKENIKNSQRLLIQENITLNWKEKAILEEYKDIFIEMWFDFEILWNNLILVNAIPEFIKKENIKDIFLWIINDIDEFNSNKSMKLEEIKNKIFAYSACRSAIKFGNKLNLFEMNKLLNDSQIVYSSTCPHWRPSIFEISLEELKKKYDR